MDGRKSSAQIEDVAPLPERWTVSFQWHNIATEEDADGWQYATDFKSLSWFATPDPMTSTALYMNDLLCAFSHIKYQYLYQLNLCIFCCIVLGFVRRRLMVREISAPYQEPGLSALETSQSPLLPRDTNHIPPHHSSANHSSSSSNTTSNNPLIESSTVPTAARGITPGAVAKQTRRKSVL